MRVALRTPIAGKLGEEFDRVIDRLLAPRLYTEPLLPPFPFETAGTEWMPIMDVIENGAEYIVRLEAPGIHKENLDINLVGEILTITGKREIAPEVEDIFQRYGLSYNARPLVPQVASAWHRVLRLSFPNGWLEETNRRNLGGQLKKLAKAVRSK